jgi:hypothetical protein
VNLQGAPEKSQFLDPHTVFIGMIGAIGNVSALFDAWAPRAITLLTLAILLHRAWIVFFKKKGG